MIPTTPCATLPDCHHPPHHLFELLPWGRRFRSLQSHTARLSNSLYQQAVRLLNTTHISVSALYFIYGFWVLFPTIHSNTSKSFSLHQFLLAGKIGLCQLVLPTTDTASGRYHLMEVNIGEDECGPSDFIKRMWKRTRRSLFQLGLHSEELWQPHGMMVRRAHQLIR